MLMLPVDMAFDLCVDPAIENMQYEQTMQCDGKDTLEIDPQI